MSNLTSGDHMTTDRLSERAHQSVDQIADTAGKTEQRIRQGAVDAKARAIDAGEKIKEQSDETLHSIRGFVRKKPLVSVGFAVAVGTLLSALTRRS